MLKLKTPMITAVAEVTILVATTSILTVRQVWLPQSLVATTTMHCTHLETLAQCCSPVVLQTSARNDNASRSNFSMKSKTNGTAMVIGCNNNYPLHSPGGTSTVSPSSGAPLKTPVIRAVPEMTMQVEATSIQGVRLMWLPQLLVTTTTMCCTHLEALAQCCPPVVLQSKHQR